MSTYKQRKENTQKALSHYLSNFFGRIIGSFQNITIDRNSLTFLIFLGLSMFFWFLQALNKEYETELKFPIKYYNSPKGYILENELPDKMLLHIKDEGFSILRYKLTNAFIPISLNIEHILNRTPLKSENGHSFIKSEELNNIITNQLASGTNLTSISPDTIHFYYSELLSKKVAVVSKFNVYPAKQHIVSGDIIIKPDSITIYGPGSSIDTIQHIYTDTENFENIQDTLVRNIALQTYENVEMDKSRVVITIPVESFTEKKLKIPVTGNAFPDSLQLRTFPGLVEVSFIVGLSHYNDIQPEDIKVFIDYTDIKNNAKGTAKIHLQINKMYIQNARLSQDELEYLVEYNKTGT